MDAMKFPLSPEQITKWKAEILQMRMQMPDYDPAIDSEAHAVHHMLMVQEFLHKKTVEDLTHENRFLWIAVAVLGVTLGFGLMLDIVL